MHLSEFNHEWAVNDGEIEIYHINEQREVRLTPEDLEEMANALRDEAE